ncbi:TonB-dependent receptor [Flavipsychrobacter stenotrophus]|uniref:TonB-dependent receptor n=1 Tax=Flavipsychrobacter stenotrophus TaxID=2077091 RepID=A0A2S7SZA2_9BACT|nr:TonB-dependent receptor [Flavipsychrobacter stenotrophus]PQJ12279.1 TonB-dependent receptor [Flavipsychrobacter stenotrophus]
MKNIFMLCWVLLFSAAAHAQQTLRLRVIDAAKKDALPGATVKVDSAVAGITDTLGSATINVSDGKHTIEISTLGYVTQNIIIQQVNNNIRTVQMEIDNASLEEVTLIASTRNNQAIESSPLKVEVLGKEEVGEEVGIRPGNIASILGDVSGVQIQQSSAVSGNANVKIQGLPGRYTQILRDGMPLYDGFSGGFGILTIPPLDLKQIELIKGSASTLFGGGAIAGLINLTSRRPTTTQEADIVANYTSLNELNLNAYVAKRYKRVGYTLFAGYSRQEAKDVDGEGFSDVPQAKSLLLHPKLFFYPSDKTIISIGYSGTFDKRLGGDMVVLAGQPDTLHQYEEHNTSGRHSGEYSIDHFYKSGARLTIKGLFSYFRKISSGSEHNIEGWQQSYYSEAALFKPYKHSELVLGTNIVGDQYRTLTTDSTLIHKFVNFTAGAFGQYTMHLTKNTTLEGGLRIDNHAKYGLFILPRAAFFQHINEHFGLRAGFGIGYKTPNPLAQQDIEYEPRYIAPVGDNIKAEISYGYNLEGNYKHDWDKDHSLFINHAFFLTQINNPTYLVYKAVDTISLINRNQPVLTMGFDTYVKLVLKKWELYGGYTFTNAVNKWQSNAPVPLTPRNRLAFVLVKEIEEDWRLGLEGSYTGSQYRYTGDKTPGYMFIALIAQYKLGMHVYIVANCENLLDYRMSKVEALYSGSISNPTFKPLWAPIDGRVVNVSVRWKL